MRLCTPIYQILICVIFISGLRPQEWVHVGFNLYNSNVMFLIVVFRQLSKVVFIHGVHTIT